MVLGCLSCYILCSLLGKVCCLSGLDNFLTQTLFSFQFDKKAMIVKFEELDDERQKEAKLVR